ncbi:snake venom metalloproteinase BITM02A-like [Microplitis mediator]|uniref:snake venom metalloproteinase BITM02A-like n=1 Tax=Microplitis mediator TaxID=375433 RepID=UPI002553C698|nr:snake venom metalloproteinase BITM02A-like [Microplitis mediator]
MKLWLKQAKSSIPYTSYDAHIIMTPYADGLVQETSTVGLAVQPSACSAAILENPNGGIIYDPYDFRAIVIGAHELGHILGAGHDDDSCGEGYIMASHESNSQKTWSQCSIDGFRKTLR